MKQRFTMFFLPVALLLAVFSLVSCVRQKPAGTKVICLVDLSDSGNAMQRKEFYRNIIRDRVIPSLGMHDALIVIPIDNASVTNSAAIFRSDLSGQKFEPEFTSPMEVDNIIQKKLKEFKEGLQTEFEKAYSETLEKRSSYGKATDLFGALEQVARELDKKNRNVVIFLSDMMNYSPQLKMEPGNSSFNRNSLENAVKNAPARSLPGATALVLTGELSDISTDHFNLVKSFWSGYFDKNSIVLYDYSSTSTTKLDELLAQKPK